MPEDPISHCPPK